MEFSDDMRLGDAREELRIRVDEGARCPCCTQFAKVYRRKIHATMARELITLYRATKGTGNWFHMPSTLGHRGGDTAKLRYWRLIVGDDTPREDGSKRNGWWRITDDGHRWVRNLATVPEYACIYDDRLLRLEGRPVSIQDALGKKFNYRELMDG